MLAGMLGMELYIASVFAKGKGRISIGDASEKGYGGRAELFVLKKTPSCRQGQKRR